MLKKIYFFIDFQKYMCYNELWQNNAKFCKKGDAIMFNLKEELVKAMEMFVQKEFVPATADGIQFFGCMDCSNSCAENCAVKCKKNGKK